MVQSRRPAGAGRRRGAASVDGQLYVVSGCTSAACVPASAATFSYDPGTNTWTKLADYPRASCSSAARRKPRRGVRRRRDAVGHLRQSGDRGDLPVRPGTNTWTRVADMPYADWGIAYAGAGGKLQVVGGIVNDSVTNQASSSIRPPVPGRRCRTQATRLYRGGGACGLYRVGGSLPSIGLEPAPYAEQLPGSDDCISGSDVAWLSTSRSGLTVAPGQTVTVTVALDASAASTLGEYDARLAIDTDTPYAVSPVPVALKVRR